MNNHAVVVSSAQSRREGAEYGLDIAIEDLSLSELPRRIELPTEIDQRMSPLLPGPNAEKNERDA